MSDAPKADQDRVISQPLVPEKKARRKNGAIKTSKGPSERDLARRAAHFAALARDPIGGAPKRVVERERRLPWSVAAIDRTMFNVSRQVIIQRATDNEFRWPCCIYGEVGRGKTYLAAAIYGHFDTRVLSRIQGGECIQLGGYDLRASGGVRIEA